LNTCKEGNYGEVLKAPPKRIISDSGSWTRYTVEAYEKPPFYIRVGTWKTYYETGVLKAKGSYLPESFDSSGPNNTVIKKGFDPEDWYFFGGFKFSGFYAGSRGYLKNGEWIYYNEIGNEIYREHFKDGLKVN
jgi:antitoxin component YwqK of YwqJK toxin-antitoxin module